MAGAPSAAAAPFWKNDPPTGGCTPNPMPGHSSRFKLSRIHFGTLQVIPVFAFCSVPGAHSFGVGAGLQSSDESFGTSGGFGNAGG